MLQLALFSFSTKNATPITGGYKALANKGENKKIKLPQGWGIKFANFCCHEVMTTTHKGYSACLVTGGI